MAARGFTVSVVSGALVGAIALTVADVPSGTLIGAVLGSALVDRHSRGDHDLQLPMWVRVVGLMMLGCVAGARLGRDVIPSLQRLAIPMLVVVALLLFLNLVLALILIRRFGIDAPTAVLACAPGGVSEMAIAAEKAGAHVGLVMAVHTARVLAVVFVTLPLLAAWLGGR